MRGAYVMAKVFVRKGAWKKGGAVVGIGGGTVSTGAATVGAGSMMARERQQERGRRAETRGPEHFRRERGECQDGRALEDTRRERETAVARMEYAVPWPRPWVRRATSAERPREGRGYRSQSRRPRMVGGHDPWMVKAVGEEAMGCETRIHAEHRAPWPRWPWMICMRPQTLRGRGGGQTTDRRGHG